MSRIKQLHPITGGEINALNLQEDINQIITTLNTLDYNNMKTPGNEFDWGSNKLKNLLDPSGAINDSTDLQVAVTKKYLQEKIYEDFLSGGGTFHAHDNKTLLDSILENKEELVNSTTTGSTSFKLVDSAVDFTTLAITKDMIVYNSTDDVYGLVTAVDDANTLSLDTDIMAAGEDYEIYPIASVELLDGDTFNSFTISPSQKTALDNAQSRAASAFGVADDRIALMSDVPVVGATGYSEAYVRSGTGTVFQLNFPELSKGTVEFEVSGCRHDLIGAPYFKFSGRGSYVISTGSTQADIEILFDSVLQSSFVRTQLESISGASYGSMQSISLGYVLPLGWVSTILELTIWKDAIKFESKVATGSYLQSLNATCRAIGVPA
jgi:hypothetical protein